MINMSNLYWKRIKTTEPEFDTFYHLLLLNTSLKIIKVIAYYFFEASLITFRTKLPTDYDVSINGESFVNISEID
jgi:hypothetical protein